MSPGRHWILEGHIQLQEVEQSADLFCWRVLREEARTRDEARQRAAYAKRQCEVMRARDARVWREECEVNRQVRAQLESDLEVAKGARQSAVRD